MKPISDIVMQRYRYGSAPLTVITVQEVLDLPRGEIWARAEDSGCEGCYCEVARLTETGFWRRFAFVKFFNGDLGDFNAYDCAKMVARFINAHHQTEAYPLIHKMTSWEG